MNTDMSSSEEPPRLETQEERFANIASNLAHQRIQRLASRGHRGDETTLMAGPEQGSYTEQAIAKILATVGLPDMRTEAEGRPTRHDDQRDGDLFTVESVYESPPLHNGIVLRLSRLRTDDDEMWLDLDALLP